MADDLHKISHSGLVARSPQGHAAKGMNIKGNEDMWVEIQAHTFRNWVNENLKETGLAVRDLSTDLCDGVKLVLLVEALQKRKLRKVMKPVNQHQYLENASTALNAISADGIKLVNIGNVDIVNGNLKLILGLIWSLIVHYQIGRSKFPPRKLMLAWLKAVLPDRNIHNFTTDWNSGVNLSALLDYCRPGLFSQWDKIDPRKSVDNCERAMKLAQKEFDIPMVLEPEYLASPFLDELSGMTYLSYFMKEHSPGYYATLRWVQDQIPQANVKNFTTDWNDGIALCTLVRSLGGPVPGYQQMDRDSRHWEENLEIGIKGGEKLGVEPVLKAVDMADPSVEHLGIMAQAAQFQWVRPRKKPGERLSVSVEHKTTRINKPATFKIDYLNPDIDLNEVTAVVRGPLGKKIECKLNLTSHGGTGTFIPTEVGMHELIVYHEGEIVTGCPINIRAMPELSKKMYTGIDPCAVGSTVEVLINSNGAGNGNINVIASSPTERQLPCPVHEDQGVYTATFQPDEAGEWKIAVTYGKEHIQGSPFTCFVFDPHAVKLLDLNGATHGETFTFQCDARGAGWGDAHFDIVYRGRSQAHRVEEVEKDIYEISFTPQQAGKHRVYVYFNGIDVKGSPFTLRVAGDTASGNYAYGADTSRTSRHSNTLDASENHSRVNASQRHTSYQNGESSMNSTSDQTFQRRKYMDELAEDGSPPKSPIQRAYSPQRRATDTLEVQRTQFSHHQDRQQDLSLNFRRESSPARHSPLGGSRLESSRQKVVSESFKSQERHHQDQQQDISLNFGRDSSPARNSPIGGSYLDNSRQKIVSESFKASQNTLQERQQDRHHQDRQQDLSLTFRRESSPARHSPSGAQQDSSRQKFVSESFKASQNTLQERQQDRHHQDRQQDLSPTFRRESSPARHSPISGSQQDSSRQKVVSESFKSQNTSQEHQSFSYLDQSTHHSSRVERSVNSSIHGIDSTSNVKVSDLVGIKPTRRDSWDALAKTRAILNDTQEDLGLNSARLVQETTIVKNVLAREENEAAQSKFSKTVDITSITLAGDGLKLVPANRTANFTIECKGLEPSDVSVKILGPSKTPTPVQVHGSSNYVTVSYEPTDVGEHAIDIFIQGQKFRGSPFRCFAYNSQEIRVGRVPNGLVGRPVEFEIDGSSAGSGNLEILVNGGHVTSFVRNLGGQRFLASFVPHHAIPHTIDMKFNGETVPGSPWHVEVMELVGASKASVVGDGVRHFAAGKIAAFLLNLSEFSSQDITVSIISPSKRSISSRLIEEAAGTCRVEFNPSEVGSYVIDVTAAGQKMQGSPFVAKAYDSTLIRVLDVSNGVVGQACQFRVDASQAGEGQLEISINDGEVPNHVQVLGGGKCLVSFTPELVKVHTIEIKFNGETVPGCPFICKVADNSRVSVSLRHLELLAIGELARFDISVDGGANSELAVSVKGPALGDVPAKVTNVSRNIFTAEFTPRDVGSHTILVEYNGMPVSGTPFICKSYDAKKVFVSAMPKGMIGKNLQFTVDASQAGEGNLEITISARGRNIPTQVHPQGSARFAVGFVPLEAIDHVITITFNKEPVLGSPFTAQIFTDPNRVVVSGQSLASSAVGKPSYFKLSNVTGSVEDIEVNVQGPSELSVPAQVKDNGDQTFHVEFMPKVAGEHRIHVIYMDKPVVGSPFSCKVYDVSAIKVKEATKGVVGKPVTFLVETSQAGPGNLEVTVNSGQVPTSAQAHGMHTYAISFTPKEAKPHEVELKFNGENVPGSPFTCQVIDSRQVTVSGQGLEKVPLDQATSFCLDIQGPPGSVDIRVLSPARKPLEVNVQKVNESRYVVKYTPTEVGDHSVEVKYEDMQIHGSPFLVKAYDARKVKVTDVSNGVVGKPVYFTIDASQAGAGNLEIIVSVSGKHVPNYVQSEGNAKFRVSFKPQEAAPHTLSVRFNGEPVPGSPYTCRITDASQIVVSGAALKMSPLTRPAILTIDPRSAEVNECLVAVLSTSGQNVPVELTQSGNKYVAQFQPFEVGPHTVSVVINGEPVGGSPFTCNIYDVNKVSVAGLGQSRVGQPITFTVDASQAGEGTLELVVTTPKSSVKADVRARSRGLYDVTFTPQEAIAHFVNITFNDEDIPGNPFKCEIRDLDAKEIRHIQRTESKLVTARGDGLKEVVLGAPAFFEVDSKGMEGPIEIKVTSPRGDLVQSHLLKMKNGIHRAEYEPDVVGTYRIEVMHQGKSISKQPFLVEVTDPAAVQILQVREAEASKEGSFTVDTSEAGRGTLNVSVRAAGQHVKHTVQNLGSGQLKVLFYPTIPVPHRVDLKYSGVHASGCPFEIPVKNPAVGKDVTATGVGLYQCRAGKNTSFVIETRGQSSRLFDVVVAGPHDVAVPVKCYQQKDGNLLAEFTPSLAGTYKVDVLCDTKAVKGSPFYCQAFDASKVSIEQTRTPSVAVNEQIAFQLSRRHAGFAELDVTVTSPLGRDLPLEVKGMPNGEGDLIEFYPTLPGKYRFAITYGGDEVPGSPVLFVVEEEGITRAYGEGLLNAVVGTPVSFYIEARGLPGEPTFQVEGPDSVAKCSLSSEEPGLYLATYTPQEVGVFDVRIMWANKEITGSPYHPKVVDPRKVRVIGGWESLLNEAGKVGLVVGTEKKISFDTSEAGPGKLGAEVRGPQGTIVPTQVENMIQRTKVRFMPSQGGEHSLYLSWNDVPLPKSPLLGLAEYSGEILAESPSSTRASSTSSSDSMRVVLTGKGLAGAICGEEAEFIIDGSKAGPGLPDVTMTGVRNDLQVSLISKGNNVYKATYSADMAGVYLLNVMWAERQVKGCPLKIAVTSVSDATKVVCSGEGLKLGTMGKDIKGFIDIRRAGPGELTTHCMGPHKPAVCELYDHRDGTFTLNVKPQEPGKHLLHVKYGGEHVPGSPFSLRVMGAPDPSKVRVYGPGVEHGVLALFQSRFLVDTRGAGAGQLTVRIRGPKGAFRVEMQRESQKDRTILCKYDPTEPGDYRIEVRWSGEHVPGSPFSVMIFDTQEELTRYLQGNYSPRGITPDFYGTVGGGREGNYSTGYGNTTHVGSKSLKGSLAQL